MVQKLILLLISVLVARQTESFDLVLVSTTELPTKNNDQNDFQQFYSALKKIEMQNAQLQKQVENCITLNKDKLLVQIEKQLTNFIKKSSEDDIIVHQEIQELKNKQEQLEHLINQYDNKSKQLNELDMKLQKLEEKLISKAADVEKNYNFKNCKEIQKSGRNVSGVYVIDLPILGNFTVFCDMVTQGGGWTGVLANKGSQIFDSNWADYKKGFGDPSGEFWIGLEPLYQLTNSEDYELLVELFDVAGDNATNYAQYNKFKIGTEKEGYSLNVALDYRGDAGNGLLWLIGNKFSTKDWDRDFAEDFNCAEILHGGWWYGNCFAYWLPYNMVAKMMIRPLNNYY